MTADELRRHDAYDDLVHRLKCFRTDFLRQRDRCRELKINGMYWQNMADEITGLMQKIGEEKAKED